MHKKKMAMLLKNILLIIISVALMVVFELYVLSNKIDFTSSLLSTDFVIYIIAIVTLVVYFKINGTLELNAGASHYQKWRLAEALTCFSKAIEINPSMEAAYTNRGMIFLLMGEPEKALTDFNAALELNPKYAMAYLNRGAYHLQMRDFENAIKDADRAIELNPKLALAYMNRGRCYTEWKDKENALKNFEQFINIYSRYAVSWTSRGICYLKFNDFDKAENDIDRAIALDKNFLLAQHYKTYCIFKGGNREEAKKRVEESIQLHPEFALSYYLRGMIYKEIRDFDKAENDFVRAMELSIKKYAEFKEGQSILFVINDYHDVIEELTDIIKHNGENPQNLKALGQAYRKVGNIEK